MALFYIPLFPAVQQVEGQGRAHEGVAVFPAAVACQHRPDGTALIAQELVRVQMLGPGGDQILRQIAVKAVGKQGGIGVAVSQQAKLPGAEAGLLQQLPGCRLRRILVSIPDAAGELGGQAASGVPPLSITP